MVPKNWQGIVMGEREKQKKKEGGEEKGSHDKLKGTNTRTKREDLLVPTSKQTGRVLFVSEGKSVNSISEATKLVETQLCICKSDF